MKCNLFSSIIGRVMHSVLFQKISIPLPQSVFLVESPTPLEIPVKIHTFLLKFWLLRPPIPIEISIYLPWGGYGYFLELHNGTRLLATCICWRKRCDSDQHQFSHYSTHPLARQYKADNNENHTAQYIVLMHYQILQTKIKEKYCNQ